MNLCKISAFETTTRRGLSGFSTESSVLLENKTSGTVAAFYFHSIIWYIFPAIEDTHWENILSHMDIWVIGKMIELFMKGS